MKSETVSEINVDVDAANGNDAVAVVDAVAAGTDADTAIEAGADVAVADVATAADPG